MQKNELSRTFILLLLFSALTAWLMIHDNFPYIGLTFMWGILATLAYTFKQPRYHFDTTLYIAILTLSAFLSIRSNGELIFYDLVGIIYLGSLLIINKHNDFNVFNIITAPVNALIPIFSVKNAIEFDRSWLEHPTRLAKTVKISKVLQSLAITLGLLVIIIPLLASANPIFRVLVETIIRDLDVGRLLTLLFGDYIGVHIARVIFTLVLFYFSLKIGSAAMHQSDSKSTPLRRHFADVLLIPKLVVGFVILVFFVTQLQLYFATTATLTALNLTNSQVTREIFAQLSIVSLIILALVYYDKDAKPGAKFSTYLLLIEGLFLAAMAYKSDFDYSVRWGFTYARLYGFSGVFWVVGMYLLFAYKYVQRIADSIFLRRAIMWLTLTIILINVVNFDYLIYHYRQSSTGAGIDYFYLSKVSPDAYSYHDQLRDLKSQMPSTDNSIVQALNNVVIKVDNLQKKYAKPDLRAFNYSEYLQYLAIKDENVAYYYDLVGQADRACRGYSRLAEALKNDQTTCWLDLSNQNLGAFPSEILRLKHLQHLILYNNQMTVLPDEIDQLTELTDLDVRHNQLTQLPASIGNLTKIESFRASQNRLSPPEVERLETIFSHLPADHLELDSQQ